MFLTSCLCWGGSKIRVKEKTLNGDDIIVLDDFSLLACSTCAGSGSVHNQGGGVEPWSSGSWAQEFRRTGFWSQRARGQDVTDICAFHLACPVVPAVRCLARERWQCSGSVLCCSARCWRWAVLVGVQRSRRMFRSKSTAPDAHPGASACTWPR